MKSNHQALDPVTAKQLAEAKDLQRAAQERLHSTHSAWSTVNSLYAALQKRREENHVVQDVTTLLLGKG